MSMDKNMKCKSCHGSQQYIPFSGPPVPCLECSDACPTDEDGYMSWMKKREISNICPEHIIRWKEAAQIETSVFLKTDLSSKPTHHHTGLIEGIDRPCSIILSRPVFINQNEKFDMSDFSPVIYQGTKKAWTMGPK